MRSLRFYLAVGPVATVATVATLLLSGLAAQKDPLAPHLRTLDRTAGQLASKGRKVAFGQLCAMLKELGVDAKSLERLQARGERAFKKAKGKAKGKGKGKAKGNAPRPAPSEAKSLRRVATKLGELLPGLTGERKAKVARVVLQLVPDSVAAHDALGHVEHKGRRVPKELVAVLERREAMRVGYQKSRRYEFELAVSGSSLPAVRAVRAISAAGGRSVTYKSISLHSPTIPEVRLRRILTAALRAWTYSNFLETGKVEPPDAPNLKVVLLRSKAEYLQAVNEALANGGIEKKYAKVAREHWGVHRDDRGFHAGWNVVESAHAAFVFRELHSYQNMWRLGSEEAEPVPPNMHKGHLEWIGRAFLGSRVPEWGWVEIQTGAQAPGTKATIEDTPQRVELLRMAKAGLSGVRAYLRYLVRRNEDPKISATIVDKAGYLTGELLLKSISVSEYLHETGRFFPMFRKARGKPLNAATFTELLGHDIGTLERRWKQWLLLDDAKVGLADRVDKQPKGTKRPAALTHLESIRKKALAIVPDVQAVGLDQSLSDACGQHVRYLIANPKQQNAWPDCHEQYSDRKGFTPEGCWAASHSVIDPGAKSGPDAVDRWIGTFYHRLPLLHPGLVRIGWAMQDRVAVLDAGSLVDDGFATPASVAYPPPGAKNVPTAFVPEMPNPVPGQDQSQFGYPITLQLFGIRETGALDVTLKLYKGSVSPKNEVPCHVSTPGAPSNPALAPTGAFCLIPKRHLARSTTYIVTLDGAPEDSKHLQNKGWRFKTGSK